MTKDHLKLKIKMPKGLKPEKQKKLKSKIADKMYLVAGYFAVASAIQSKKRK